MGINFTEPKESRALKRFQRVCRDCKEIYYTKKRTSKVCNKCKLKARAKRKR